MDKTVKIRAYAGEVTADTASASRVEEKNPADERAKLSAMLDDERNKTRELLKESALLRESLKQEQAKAADLEGKLNRLATVEESQLAKKTAQLEEERKNALELMKTIEQLKEGLKQEHARMAELSARFTALEASAKDVAVLEARVRELSDTLGKIAALAVAGKQGGA